ncbi:hypothetical protein BDN71DRAFT_1015438 [Pleurotus eryngii]|uniref:Altered inheritance of mitochondria protein 11 n=1 Tax=Pleurotus eryngii TaxID=5323 RepID=A0A9P5ZWN7_PLEER|nr:hypothetical protein BDN71DRAFT_1015438 [Pleurotus eryngii]
MDSAPASPDGSGKKRNSGLHLTIVATAGASLLAIGMPLVYLLRQRASRTLLREAPPRRTVSQSTSPLISGNTSRIAAADAAAMPSRPIVQKTGQNVHVDDFNGALHSAKAFGLATLLVAASATATVYGIKTWMRVQSTEEFAHRMRAILLAKMPSLSERIHRLADPDDDDASQVLDAPTVSTWNWPDAEQRLKAAFEKDGFAAWIKAAGRELEMEGRLERSKRFGTDLADNSSINNTSS